ncbi:MAG: GldG family protein, partial [Planctomycetes bacterium]|nr:GldG family protein [Planctomycetota bacterium]
MIRLSQDIDWGVIFTTYLGYWMAGCSLLTAGMLASSLTKSTPVAFVLGAVFCVIPVGISSLDTTSDFLRLFTVQENLRDFTNGLIPWSGVMYFLSFAGLMLYLNVIVINRRHWSSSTQSGVIGNYFTRAICLLVTFVSLTYAATYAVQPADFSEEGLYTLSDSTLDLIASIDEERPVEIQAFISPEVPREYLETRKTLISLLDRLQRLGNGKITVRRVEVTPFDENSDEAETLGIEPIAIRQEINGRVKPVDVFLGAVVRSSYDEVILPFFGKGLPLEYELARAIGTVSKEKRLKIGILKTDADIASEDDLNGQGEWRLVQTLRQHYDVSVVDPAKPIIAKDKAEDDSEGDTESPDSAADKDPDDAKPEEFDVLLAVMPSSLTEPEMENFLDYVKSGRPTLIFDDPFPLFMSRPLMGGARLIGSAPRLPKPSPAAGMMGMFGGAPPTPEPKADQGKLTRLMDYLQVAWGYDEIVWDQFNPHLELELNFDHVFVSNESGKFRTFSD